MRSPPNRQTPTATDHLKRTPVLAPLSSRLPPPPWRPNVASVLLTRRQIDRRVRELARWIQHDYAGREPLIVGLLNGTLIFMADLLRHLHLPVQVEFMGVSSYRHASRPGSRIVTKNLRLNLRNRDVLVLDDILDTGQTLSWVLTRLQQLHPRELKVCVLLAKQVRRPVPIRPDYLGFHIPNAFVVGYGLDYAERFRNLPFIGILHPNPPPPSSPAPATHHPQATKSPGSRPKTRSRATKH